MASEHVFFCGSGTRSETANLQLITRGLAAHTRESQRGEFILVIEGKKDFDGYLALGWINHLQINVIYCCQNPYKVTQRFWLGPLSVDNCTWKVCNYMYVGLNKGE